MKKDRNCISMNVNSGENAHNNVAGGNIIIQGMPFSEVKVICLTLFDANFPKLVEAAKKEAAENTIIFLDKYLKEKLVSEPNIDISRLSNPDIQFSLNQAIQASAQKGVQIDLDILSDMVVNRL